MAHAPNHFLETLPVKLRGGVERLLDPDEELLWLGQPIPEAYGRRFIGCVVGGVLWLLFIALLAHSCASNPAPQPTSGYFFLGVLGLLGVAGCWMPLVGRWMARRTVYGVTNRRVFATSTWGLGLASWALPWEETGLPCRWRWHDGCGSLKFPDKRPRALADPDDSRHFGFHALPDVNRIYGLIEATWRGPSNSVTHVDKCVPK
ncbi:hypothetical protein Pla108_03330 [Botrimarina colliarenosi]|uniref:Uncharacterized protein n=1 Tax=Botrimarina colliarenosi TaxID=2528001 RepID=A0A5C6AJ28_9BACT|nr:hypothetical protein Pla108_03330 [Botrimarina colliarenosi]